jgi:CPA2 family monovalent cation:H+ antiporter-2
LLLFSLGIEFSVGELTEGGRGLIVAASVFLVLNIGAGVAFGAALGWGMSETLVLAGALGISSSAIVTKLLIEFHRLDNRETPTILGIIVAEDLFLALYLAVLQPVLEDSQGVGDTLASIGTAFGFLLALALLARFGAKWVSRFVETDDDELLTVCFVGIAILAAGVAEEVGVSDAIGAFMAGLVLAESPSRERIRKLVRPIRDVFAALFFFAFGVSVDPNAIGDVAGPIAAAVAVTIVVNIAAAVIVARLRQLDRHEAANLGLTILARGEFSLIVATIGVEAGLDGRIAPLTAGYVLVLAIVAPVLASNTGRFALTRFARPPRKSPPAPQRT